MITWHGCILPHQGRTAPNCTLLYFRVKKGNFIYYYTQVKFRNEPRYSLKSFYCDLKNWEGLILSKFQPCLDSPENQNGTMTEGSWSRRKLIRAENERSIASFFLKESFSVHDLLIAKASVRSINWYCFSRLPPFRLLPLFRCSGKSSIASSSTSVIRKVSRALSRPCYVHTQMAGLVGIW